jgi:Uma2 family endonuclease
MRHPTAQANMFTHGAAKAEIATELQVRVTRPGLGSVFVDRARIASGPAQLSVEPDVVVVLWETIDTGKVRLVPKKRSADRYLETEGGPDVVVEVVSDSSVDKDLERLPPLYAAAGVPELWLTDARGANLRFDILTLQGGSYRPVAADEEGWLPSPRLGRAFRLERTLRRPGIWTYRLASR